MYLYPMLYTDGHAKSLDAYQAALLRDLGLVEPHPGVGKNGLQPGDLRLTENTTWEQVYEALRSPNTPENARVD